MEIKSNNVLIGTFALVVLACIFGFALWISQVQLDRQYSYYQIIFRGSVSGLSKSGSVQFNGLPVGRVMDLHLDENDPSEVVALIQLDARTPVKEDSIAQLEASGITGVAVIQITGGSPGSQLLKPKTGETYATIRGAPSTLQELAKSAPETLQSANQLLQELNATLANNQKSIGHVVENIDKLSTELADSSADMKRAIKNLADASEHFSSLSRSADSLVKNDAKGLIADLRNTSESYRHVADNLDQLLRVNGPAINRMSRDGLTQIPQLVSETRELVTALDRIVSRAQDDPARFLIGKNVPEVKAQ